MNITDIRDKLNRNNLVHFHIDEHNFKIEYYMGGILKQYGSSDRTEMSIFAGMLEEILKPAIKGQNEI